MTFELPRQKIHYKNKEILDASPKHMLVGMTEQEARLVIQMVEEKCGRLIESSPVFKLAKNLREKLIGIVWQK